MRDLEQTLLQIGRELDWPETPDLASSVTARLAAPPAVEGPAAAERPAAAEPGPSAPAPAAVGRRLGRLRRLLPSAGFRRLLPPAGLRRALVLALVSLLVLSGAVFAAVPSVRDAVLEFIGLQGATIERREDLPPAPPVAPLDLGSRTTLEAADERLAFSPLVPADTGEPDGVYVSDRAPGGELSLTYRAREGLPRARTTGLGLLVTQIRGDLMPDFFQKLAPEAAVIEELTVDGEPAAWIEGAEHFFFYRAPNGEVVEDELRLAQNVLLFQRGPLLIRLEGAFDRNRALEIAASLR
jgi:hypothetical protein